MTAPTVFEREHLAQRYASGLAPMLAFAVAQEDAGLVEKLLGGLTRQELLTLAVVLAAEHPRPLTRPDDGIVDPVAIERAAAGEAVPLSEREKRIAARRMRDRGESPLTIGRRLQISHSTVSRWLAAACPDTALTVVREAAA